MEINDRQEFIFALSWIGGLALASLLVIFVITGFVIVLNRKQKDGKTIKKLYEQERKNGRAGSRGKF